MNKPNDDFGIPSSNQLRDEYVKGSEKRIAELEAKVAELEADSINDRLHEQYNRIAELERNLLNAVMLLNSSCHLNGNCGDCEWCDKRREFLSQFKQAAESEGE